MSVNTKGKMLRNFKTGDCVRYTKTYKPGEVGLPALGHVLTLHNSGNSGTAEICPADGGRKITRKLSRISKV